MFSGMGAGAIEHTVFGREVGMGMYAGSIEMEWLMPGLNWNVSTCRLTCSTRMVHPAYYMPYVYALMLFQLSVQKQLSIYEYWMMIPCGF